MRDVFNQALHGNTQSADGLIARLNNESVGALVFGESAEQLVRGREYVRASSDLLEEFARKPHTIALQMGMTSRLSLAGAQAKIGMRYLDGKWYIPMGSAPSTHIIKASDGVFANLAINELICLETARQMGFDVARAFLIPVEAADPLLAVERFDRVVVDNYPHRIHQEDFVQAKGFSSPYIFKYEPTDGNYLKLCESLVSQISDNPFGDRMLFFQQVLYDYCIGNTDNHLKNHSFFWSEDWKHRELSPLYDLTCCTLYGQLDREMGVSLCANRRIDDVTRTSIFDVARNAGIPATMIGHMVDDVLEGFLPALHDATVLLVSRYAGDVIICNDIEKVARGIEADARKRLETANRMR